MAATYLEPVHILGCGSSGPTQDRLLGQTDLMHSTSLYCTEFYCTPLFCTALYCTALYCTLLYCTVSVFGRDKGYTVKYKYLPEGVPEGEAQGNS